MADIYLPTLHAFAMCNDFSGSHGMLRFMIKPAVTLKPNSKEVDFEASHIDVEIWHGLYCYEKSQIEEARVFPLSDEGRQGIIDWLTELI